VCESPRPALYRELYSRQLGLCFFSGVPMSIPIQLAIMRGHRKQDHGCKEPEVARVLASDTFAAMYRTLGKDAKRTRDLACSAAEFIAFRDAVLAADPTRDYFGEWDAIEARRGRRRSRLDKAATASAAAAAVSAANRCGAACDGAAVSFSLDRSKVDEASLRSRAGNAAICSYSAQRGRCCVTGAAFSIALHPETHACLVTADAIARLPTSVATLRARCAAMRMPEIAAAPLACKWIADAAASGSEDVETVLLGLARRFSV
jgi:hypothetical protein